MAAYMRLGAVSDADDVNVIPAGTRYKQRRGLTQQLPGHTDDVKVTYMYMQIYHALVG